MFAAILLVLAGIAGLVFRVVRPMLTVDDAHLLAIGSPLSAPTTVLCAATLLLGLWSFLRQAAWSGYAGAATAILSLGMYGLVPAYGLAAIVFLQLSRREGEETKDDDVLLPASLWPDKAMATSLFLVMIAGIALTQAVLILLGRYDPLLVRSDVLAGALGIAIAVLCLVAARETYRIRRPWLAWTALVLSLGTVGFFLIGPLYAVAGMVFLALAHREGEFDEFAPEVLAMKARRRKARAPRRNAA